MKNKRGHNEGSIRQSKDGRWEVRVTAGIDFETGKPKRISYYTDTKAEATKLLHEVEYKIHIDEMVDPTSVTLYQWLSLWLETYMKNSLKQSTYTSYAGYINNHFAPAIGGIKLKELTTKILQDFYNYKLTKQELSPKTISNMHRCLHKALKQAVLEHHINFNPCDAVNLPRTDKPQIEIFTIEEQQRLMYTSFNFRYGIFIRLTLATGIRLGELLGLRWEDVDARTNMLYIRRTLNRLEKVDYDGTGNKTEIVIQEPKTQNSVRSIPLMKSIINELMQWRSVQLSDAQIAGAAYQNSGFIVTNQFGGYIEPRTFKDYYNTILDAANLGHFTFHALRHTFTTRALEKGMDSKTLSTILGHYSVAFTLDTYTHILDSQKHEEMKCMEDLFNMSSVSQNHSYPIIVAPAPNGFILNAVDFDETSVEADNIQYGISYIQSQISQQLLTSYPPIPTPTNEVQLAVGEFVVMVNI